MRAVVYVCSPYRAKRKMDFQVQLATTKEISREVVLAGLDVITPHLYYPLFLDDNAEDQRVAGMESALRLLAVCDFLYVYIGLGVSSGMKAEIELAEQKDIPRRYFRNTNELKDILKRSIKLDVGQENK